MRIVLLALGLVVANTIGCQSQQPAARNTLDSTGPNCKLGPFTTGLVDVSLTGNPQWPVGTTKTAGGFYILLASTAEGQSGGQGFAIYGPKLDGSILTGLDNNFALARFVGSLAYDGKGDNALFGTSANSDIRLPDGTTIALTNHSQLTGLPAQTGPTTPWVIDIQNGNSHISFTWTSNNSTGKYVSSGDLSDGITWITQHLPNTNWSHHTFKLAIDTEGQPSFYDYFEGQVKGLTKGASVGADETLEPIVDQARTYFTVAPQYVPHPPAPAYYNTLFNNALQVFVDPKFPDEKLYSSLRTRDQVVEEFTQCWNAKLQK
jgi:hypothetical protein